MILLYFIYFITFYINLNESIDIPFNNYLSNNDYTQFLKNLRDSNPNLITLDSLGKSTIGEDILIIKISSFSVKKNEPNPMFLYAADVRGDDELGKHILLNLVPYILVNYGKDDRITSLIDSVDIYVLPSLRMTEPDNSTSTDCVLESHEWSPSTFNRKVKPEIQLFAQWVLKKPLVLCGIINSGKPISISQSNELSSDSSNSKNIFLNKIIEVLKSNETSYENDPCPQGLSVKNYLTNYLFTNGLEISFDLNCCRRSPVFFLKNEWSKHLNGLISFIEVTSFGVSGNVLTNNDEPVEGAIIEITNSDYNITSLADGTFHHLLLPGEYKIKVHLSGYYTVEKNFKLVNKSMHLEPFLLRKVHKVSSLSNEISTVDKYGFIISPTFKHHNYVEMVDFLTLLSKEYRSITSVYSAGKSVEGRELYVLELSNHPGLHTPGNPEVKIVANMHGNEVVGRELCLLFALYLCQNYGRDDRITHLLNTTRIHLMPSMNPDGYERSKEGDYDSVRGRANANGFDLNRNFPDQYGTTRYNAVVQPETAAVMQWFDMHPFVLSANLHGGALVANYPYDDNPSMKDSIPNYTPDQKTFYMLAKDYSMHHSRMHLSPTCINSTEVFPNGVTNGAEWYIVQGGMQDYNYVYKSIFEITLELGCYKFPPSSKLTDFWMENKEALISFVEEAHKGFRGFVLSTEGVPIEGASIQVEGVNKTISSSKYGDYFRIIVPGVYTVEASASGYVSQTLPVTVYNTSYRSMLNFSLVPIKIEPKFNIDFDVPDNIINVEDFMSKTNIEISMSNLDASLPSYAQYMSDDIFPSIKISYSVASGNEDKFHIAILGNIYSSEPVGREMSLRLAKLITNGLKVNNTRLFSILNNVVVHIYPVIESDIKKVPCLSSSPTSNPFALELISGDNLNISPQVKKFLHFIDEENFDLIITIEGGGTSLIYPTENVNKMELQVYNSFSEKYNLERPFNVKCNKALTVNMNTFKQEVLAFFRTKFNTLTIGAQVGCCYFNPANQMVEIWKEYRSSLVDLLEPQGVRAFVSDINNSPMRMAVASVNETLINIPLTPNQAILKIFLAPGYYSIKFSCLYYHDKYATVIVEKGKISNVKIVMKPLDFLTPSDHLVKNGSGVIGYIISNNHPLDSAVVKVAETNKSVTVNGSGEFWINLPKGQYLISASADGYVESSKLVRVTMDNPQPLLFSLVRDDLVFGIPRFTFVLLAATAGMMSLGLLFFCYTLLKDYRNRQKGFFLVPTKSSIFRDDDPTELFKTPLRGSSYNVMPYYDQSDYEDYNTDSEEEIIVVNSGQIQMR